MIIECDTDSEALRRWLAIPVLGMVTLFWLALVPILAALFGFAVVRWTLLPDWLTSPTTWIAAGAAAAVPWNRWLERRGVYVRLMFIPAWMVLALLGFLTLVMALLEALHLARPFFR